MAIALYTRPEGEHFHSLEAHMNKIMLFPLMLTLLVGLFVSPQNVEASSWEIDKKHKNFYFSVDHIYAKVRGRFTDYTGTLVFDPDNRKDSKNFI